MIAEPLIFECYMPFIDIWVNQITRNVKDDLTFDEWMELHNAKCTRNDGLLIEIVFRSENDYLVFQFKYGI